MKNPNGRPLTYPWRQLHNPGDQVMVFCSDSEDPVLFRSRLQSAVSQYGKRHCMRLKVAKTRDGFVVTRVR